MYMHNVYANVVGHCTYAYIMMMIAFITIKSSLVPLIEGLCAYIQMYKLYTHANIHTYIHVCACVCVCVCVCIWVCDGVSLCVCVRVCDIYIYI